MVAAEASKLAAKKMLAQGMQRTIEGCQLLQLEALVLVPCFVSGDQQILNHLCRLVDLHGASHRCHILYNILHYH